MRALLYLTKRSFINNWKKAVKKPISLLSMVATAAYAVFLIIMLGSLVNEFDFGSSKGMVVLLTLWTLYIFFMNFLAYSSRKGIIFRPAHAHFIFTAPISPKTVLVHAAWMNYVLSIVVCLIFVFGGILFFHVEPWRMAVYVALYLLEFVLEISLMVCLYSNERIPQGVISKLCFLIKIFLFGITAVIFFYFWKNGVTLETASTFFDWPVLQMIPLAGWNIAAFRLVILGPDALNILGTVLYLLSAAVLFWMAYRMQCSGEYYEDAAKFADNYAEAIRRKKNGEMVLRIGEKKKRFRKTDGMYHATGAKAIFYRQILEYKKERFFIFSKTTLLSLVIAVIFSIALQDTVYETGRAEIILLGILAYMTLIFTGYLGKWEEEIKSPYLYLIPDNPIKKLWYSTLMEHIKAAVDGALICIPIGIAWKIRPLEIVLGILIYTVLQANRMYSKVIAQCVVGDTLGKTGQELIRAFFQMFILGIGAAVAAIIGVLISEDLVFPIVLIYSMIVTVVIGLIAAIRFDSMEQTA